jgi:peptide/nickel transport system substrate-binding protein
VRILTGPTFQTRIAAIAAAIVLLSACSQASPSASPGNGGGDIETVTWAGKNSVGSLDPHLSYDSGTTNYATYAECEALLRFDQDGQVQPLIAESFTQVDTTTYTIKLKSGPAFWDGNAVTADDVVYSLNRVSNPDLASPLAGLASTMDSVTKTGDAEVTIKLKNADPPFPFKLATPMGAVVEQAFVEQAGADFGTAPDKVMCTGPFRPSEWTKGEKIVFQRFDAYWDATALPKVKNFVIRELTDSATLVAGLKSGEIDGTFDLDGRNAQQLESDSSLVVTAGPGNQFNYISPVLQAGPFSDERVRKALSYAIDRTGLAEAVSGKYGQPLKAAVPPGLSAWATDKFNAAYDALEVPLTPDLATAKQLIKNAGAEGLKIEVIVQESPTADIVGPAIQQAGTAIGLDISIKKLPTADWAAANFSGIQPRPFDSMLNFWAADYPDMSADLVIPFSNEFSNVEGFDDPDYKALQDAWTEADPQSDAAATALIAMQKMLADKTVKIPLYVDPTIFVHSAAIGGYTQTKFWFYQNFAQQLSGS